ncbi:MAG: site-specific DNA-methyltransferase [Armatimonadetes bacterium]|nr:site-specific DNA-methyltransferase [Armatimonadota bacterium]
MVYFVGTGATAVVSQRLGRQWIGIEKNPIYYEAACNRLQNSQIVLIMERQYAYHSTHSR